jgi:2-keto-myo-inositol isomerase
MELLASIGGTGIAAPPAGARDVTNLDLLAAAKRYAEVIDVGREFAVIPLVEFWGFAQSLHTLGEAALIAIESAQPEASILADVYHLYRGGSTHETLHLLGGAIRVLHMNDYPARPRQSLTDTDRVWPGDGDAPIRQILHNLRRGGFTGAVSLELFNESYWKMDALEAARIGLEKMRQACEM